MDIVETKEALSFALKLGMAVDGAILDGYQWTDLFALVPPLTSLPQAVDGAEKILAEIKDMDDKEKAELFALVDTLELNSEKSEVLIEQALKVITEIGRLVLIIREAKQTN